MVNKKTRKEGKMASILNYKEDTSANELPLSFIPACIVSEPNYYYQPGIFISDKHNFLDHDQAQSDVVVERKEPYIQEALIFKVQAG